MKKGFSTVALIIIIVALVVLGFGGFVGYKFFTDPTFNFFGLIQRTPVFVPANLVQYINGKNAEILLFYNRDDAFAKKLDELFQTVKELPAKPSDVVAAIAAVRPPDASGTKNGAIEMAVQFGTEENAKTARDQIAVLAALVSISVERQNDVLLLKLDPSSLEGSILENPLLQKADPAYFDSQFIVLVNTKNSVEATDLFNGLISSAPLEELEGENLQSFLAPAHAQGLISPTDTPLSVADASGSEADRQILRSHFAAFSLFQAGYIRFSSNLINVHMVTDFADKADLGTLDKNKSLPKENLTTLYDDGFARLDDIIKKIPSLSQKSDLLTQVKADRVGLKFTLDFELDSSKLSTLIDNAPKARDASRKADLNNLVVIAETYNSEKGNYPQESACIEDMGEDFQSYFKVEDADLVSRGVTRPSDPQGLQKFGDIECESGYYYQYFGGDTYAFVGKMENNKSGNTAWPLVLTGPTDIVNLKSHQGGEYYAAIQGSGLILDQAGTQEPSDTEAQNSTSQETSEIKKKVKRQTIEPTTQETQLLETSG